MEQQDLLNALKGKRLHWRDEDNENDGVIDYITTIKEGEYLLLFDDFAQVAMDKLHIEELATTGHTCDGKYSYNLDEPPIEYIRKALVGKTLCWGDLHGEPNKFKGVIRNVEEDEDDMGNFFITLDNDDEFVLCFSLVNQLIADGDTYDCVYQYTLLEDKPNTALNVTTTNNTTTTTSGDIVYSDGIDWEARTWEVSKIMLQLLGNAPSVEHPDAAETAISCARSFITTYKAMEGKR